MTADRLYGLPDAERMHSDIDSVYDCDIDGYRTEDQRGPWVIEEWTVQPVTFHPYYAESVAEDACETLSDELGEDPAGEIHEAASSPEVIAAFRTALDLLASKVNYRMADEHVASWKLTIDDEGEQHYVAVPVDTKEDTP